MQPIIKNGAYLSKHVYLKRYVLPSKIQALCVKPPLIYYSIYCIEYISHMSKDSSLRNIMSLHCNIIFKVIYITLKTEMLCFVLLVQLVRRLFTVKQILNIHSITLLLFNSNLRQVSLRPHLLFIGLVTCLII